MLIIIEIHGVGINLIAYFHIDYSNLYHQV